MKRKRLTQGSTYSDKLTKAELNELEMLRKVLKQSNLRNQQRRTQGNPRAFHVQQNVCYTCDRPGHVSWKCSQPPKTCFTCEQQGHIQNTVAVPTLPEMR